MLFSSSAHFRLRSFATTLGYADCCHISDTTGLAPHQASSVVEQQSGLESCQTLTLLDCCLKPLYLSNETMESPEVFDVKCAPRGHSLLSLAGGRRGITEVSSTSTVEVSHQFPGATCGLPSPAVFFTSSSRSSCAYSVGHHLQSVSFKSSRWHKVSQVSICHSIDSHLVSSLSSIDEGCSPVKVNCDKRGRCSVQVSSVPWEMEASPRCGTEHMATVRKLKWTFLQLSQPLTVACGLRELSHPDHWDRTSGLTSGQIVSFMLFLLFHCCWRHCTR